MSVFASRPLVFSTLLHASVAGFLLVVMLRIQREPAPMPVIMEWVTVEPAQPALADAGPAMRTISTAVNFTPVPVAVPVRARVVEETVPATQMRTSPSLRTPDAAQPVPARITISEHRRRNSTAAPSRPVVAASFPAPARINMDEVLSGSDREGPMPAAGVNSGQEADYWAALLGKLRSVHQKPAALDDGLSVRVEFVLRADGSVGDVRILTSSGSAAFDASVVTAFRRVSGLGPPPAGKTGVNRVTFRTQAE